MITGEEVNFRAAPATEQTGGLLVAIFGGYQKMKCIAKHHRRLKFQVPGYCGD